MNSNTKNKTKALLNELKIGERSGFLKKFDRDKALKKLHDKYFNTDISKGKF